MTGKSGKARKLLSLGTALAAVWAGPLARAQDQPPAPADPARQLIGRTLSESGPPVWPARPQAPKGAPNVLVVLLDDVGFATSSSFGGLVPRPALDALAQSGVRYTNFNTAAMCSATRAALLTGRYNHNVNMESVTGQASGYPGFTTVMPKSAGTMAEILKQNGYGTAAFGKWHLTPQWEESEAGPFDNWPTGMGFEYYYGFRGPDISQWAPGLVNGTSFVQPPADDPDYFFERDMTDHAIAWLRRQHQLAPDKPFFAYYAPGAAHAPHHVPKDWLEKFRGKFDAGWDVMREQVAKRQKEMGIVPASTDLTPRPPQIPAWDSLSADQKRVQARLFEAYAAQLAYVDHQFSRIVDELRQNGQLDNTLIVFIDGDNGGSAEGGINGSLYEQAFINNQVEDFAHTLKNIDAIGGPMVYNHFAAGWAWAINTPFRQYKQVSSHFGSMRNGLVVSWPARIKQAGAISAQFHHVADIMPTVLDAIGLKAPTQLNGVPQQAVDGVSMLYTFTSPQAPSQRTVQAFSTVGNYGIYSNGWWAGTTPTQQPWELYSGQSKPIEQRNWELYKVDSDFSQAHDLAARQPAKLRQMQELFWAEAGRNNMLPLHGSDQRRKGLPNPLTGRSRFVFRPGLVSVPEEAAPLTRNRSFSVEAHVDVPAQGATGVMLAQGGRFGGFSLFLNGGRPTFHYNAIGPHQYSVAAPEPLAPGRRVVAVQFRSDGGKRGAGGAVSLLVDGKVVARGRIEQTLGTRLSHSEGLDVGIDTLTPVSEAYTVSTSRFTGTLHEVIVTLD